MFDQLHAVSIKLWKLKQSSWGGHIPTGGNKRIDGFELQFSDGVVKVPVRAQAMYPLTYSSSLFSFLGRPSLSLSVSHCLSLSLPHLSPLSLCLSVYPLCTSVGPLCTSVCLLSLSSLSVSLSSPPSSLSSVLSVCLSACLSSLSGCLSVLSVCPVCLSVCLPLSVCVTSNHKKTTKKTKK